MPAPAAILIANRTSGRGRGAARLEATERELQTRGVEYVLRESRAPGHAVQLAADAVRSGARLLLTIGGDGTVRDTAAGILDATSAAIADAANGVALGILGGGTGNDLARTLGIPSALGPALDLALGGPALPLDAWWWNETPFVNVSGVGLDAAVAHAVNRRFRRLRGTLAYIAAFVHTLPRFHPFELRLESSDVEWQGRAWLAAFANARYYGGGMEIAPAADPTDGKLDIVVVEDVPRMELLRQFPKLFRGRHVDHPRVRTLQAEAVRVIADLQAATIDGELIEKLPARVRRGEGKVLVRALARER